LHITLTETEEKIMMIVFSKPQPREI